MAATIREVVHSTTTTAVTGAGTEATDILLTFHGSNYYDAGAAGANMVEPTGTVGSWVEVAFAELGVNNSHLKAWVGVASAGANTVTIVPLNDEDRFNTTLVIAGADTADPIDDAAATTAAGTSSPAAPSVAPVSDDALLICAAMSQVFGTIDYTAPGSMVEQSEDDSNATLTTAAEALNASGATGTRTFAATSAISHVLMSIAVRAAAGDIAATLDATSPAATATTAASQTDLATLDAEAPAASASTAATQDNPATAVATAPTATAVIALPGGSTVVPKPDTGTIARPDTGIVVVPRLVYP